MFLNQSMTGTGIAVVVVLFVLQWLGFEVSEDGVAGFVKSVVEVAAFVMVLYGQWRRKDIKWGIFRK